MKKPIAFTLLWLFISIGSFSQTDKLNYKKIGNISVFESKSKGVYFFTSGFMVDADGSPKAYNKDNKKALDYLANAGKPGNWWAIATDNGKSTGTPIEQSGTDPAPGFYVSMTSLTDNSKKYEDPNRYVNSDSIPFIVIPRKFAKDFKLGDIALVINKTNHKRSFAIVADTGPANKIGEGSIYLAGRLGVSGNPKRGGVASNIFYILIKNSGKGKFLTKEEIQQAGEAKLSESDINELLK